MPHSSLSLSSHQPITVEEGAGLPTVLRLNNNGEVNIACLHIYFIYYIELLDYHNIVIKNNDWRNS